VRFDEQELVKKYSTDAVGQHEAPNGLRVSRQLEEITSLDRECLLPLPDAKIASIQLVGCTRLLGRAKRLFGCR
jgi:hypothetical protein